MENQEWNAKLKSFKSRNKLPSVGDQRLRHMTFCKTSSFLVVQRSTSDISIFLLSISHSIENFIIAIGKSRTRHQLKETLELIIMNNPTDFERCIRDHIQRDTVSNSLMLRIFGNHCNFSLSHHYKLYIKTKI